MTAGGFLRVRNWEKYQNADLAKKSGADGLAWVKLWTRDDYELSQESYLVRLLFVEILKLAGREMNAIPNDLNWISSRCDMNVKDVAKGLDVLLKQGWLSQTKSNRRSRQHSRQSSRPEVEVEVEEKSTSATPLTLLKSPCPECDCAPGVHASYCSLRKQA